MPRDGAGLGRLAWFRDELYRCFTGWPDALMDLCDAVLCREGPVRSLAELSLAPEFRRGHGSLYAALAKGGIGEDRFRDALVSVLPEGLPLLFAVDLTTWPRPDAECSAQRVECYSPCRCDGRHKTVAGWSYSRVTGVEWGSSSWVFPVDAARLRPCDDQVEVAAAQVAALEGRLRKAGRCGRPGQPVPMAVFDAGYAPPALAWALRDVRVQVLVRLRDEKRRVFWGPPPPRTGRAGRPSAKGRRFKLEEWRDWPPPDQELAVQSAKYGKVTVRAWHGLHQELQSRGYFARHPLPGRPVEGTVIQVTAERLPRGRARAGHMWLWHAAPAGVPCDLDVTWRGYLRRFDCEHGFRFDNVRALHCCLFSSWFLE